MSREEWNKEERLNYYKKRFEQQKELIASKMMPGEEFKHCIDNKSFGGKYYYPELVVTSYGRIWSLWSKRWKKIFLDTIGSTKEYHYIVVRNWPEKTNTTRYVHCLVANYFCDKTIIDELMKYTLLNTLERIEAEIEVHHKKAFSRDKSSTDNNNAKNLQYVLKLVHDELHYKVLKELKGYELSGNTDTEKQLSILSKCILESYKKYPNIDLAIGVDNVEFDENGKIKSIKWNIIQSCGGSIPEQLFNYLVSHKVNRSDGDRMIDAWEHGADVDTLIEEYENQRNTEDQKNDGK